MACKFTNVFSFLTLIPKFVAELYFQNGMCRWAWCLPCGFDHLVPYFYVIYFGALLGELLQTFC